MGIDKQQCDYKHWLVYFILFFLRTNEYRRETAPLWMQIKIMTAIYKNAVTYKAYLHARE